MGVQKDPSRRRVEGHGRKGEKETAKKKTEERRRDQEGEAALKNLKGLEGKRGRGGPAVVSSGEK